MWGGCLCCLFTPPSLCTQSSPCSLCGARVTSQLESVRVCVCVCVVCVLSLHPPSPRTQSSPCSLCGARVTSQLELVMVCVWGGWVGVCVCCPFTPPHVPRAHPVPYVEFPLSLSEWSFTICLTPCNHK